MTPPKIMPVIGLIAPLKSGPLRAAGSIEPGKTAISLMIPLIRWKGLIFARAM